MAAWDQEGSERMAGWAAREGHNTSLALPAVAISSRASFLAAAGTQARAMAGRWLA